MENNSWKATRTIPTKDFQKSLPLMSPQQVSVNIVEISLTALRNPSVLSWLQQQMHRPQFYLKYRYILENVLNGKNISPSSRESLNFAAAKFDERFINGPEEMEYSQKAIWHMPLEKDKRLKFVNSIEKVIGLLDQLSQDLLLVDPPEEKRAIFDKGLQNLNYVLQERDEAVSNGEYSPTVLHGFIFCVGLSLRKAVNINPKSSFFIKTRNRNPLVLDFQFGRFLYKIDDQLGHEIISMEFFNYLNTILGKQYIITYDISPFKIGALYEFVDGAHTIHQIKAQQEEGGLLSYFKRLAEQKGRDQVLSRFAETYSGFCLAQYLLDIKDRNNCNIMITEDGAIFHIDLAFIFSAGPGGMSFESAPFKMTKEYVNILGGFESDAFRKFQSLLVQHFTKLLQCRDQILWKMKIFEVHKKQIVCFRDFKADSFLKKLPKKQQKIKEFVEDLIDSSYDSWKTSKYDDFQFKSNNILK